MRTLAVDLGSRRVGLALSDEGGRLATPLTVLKVANPLHATQQVLAVIRRHSPQRLLVGVPINMDDTWGQAAHAAVRWGRELAEQAGVPVVFVDERLSSFQAEQSLADRKRGGERLTRRRRKQQLDAVAAAAFLQAFLDGRLAALEVGR